MRPAFGAIGLALLLAATACGVKRPPIAPGDLRPKEPRGFRVASVAGGLELSWRAPRSYDEGFPITAEQGWDLVGFHVVRRSGEGSLAVTVADVPAAPFVQGRGEPRYGWRDEALEAGVQYTYWVRAYGSDGFDGAAAGPASFTWESPPAPPALRAEAGDRQAVLAWTPSEGAARVRVYLDSDTGSRLIGDVPAAAGRQTAVALENGRAYRFVARAVSAGGVEGPSSPEVVATPADNLAPAAPRDLLAVVHPEGVLLQWTLDSLDDDVAGYEIEGRPQTGRGDWAVLNRSGLVPGPTFLYPEPRAVDWMFQVRTVDRSGLRSSPAGPVRTQP